MTTRNRVDVIHGVNLDMLGRRPAQHYGDLTFDQLEQQIGTIARELDLEARFFQTNHEGELVEHLHRVGGLADAIIFNPGAWTHYAWAIRDALEIAGLPTVEVHLSDVDAREEFRKVSVIRDLCFATVKGEGVEGYRTALAAIKEKLEL
ncbi:type II 3-dehydroquinate dehydratase [Baekduia sp. Peel2402]|uniref:type II 3-dehydroquinate dehydratase n=1 Tax=Baekduia sp. Peel2402 TaxID=3458296 RepID=UPI00403E75C7